MAFCASSSLRLQHFTWWYVKSNLQIKKYIDISLSTILFLQHSQDKHYNNPPISDRKRIPYREQSSFYKECSQPPFHHLYTMLKKLHSFVVTAIQDLNHPVKNLHKTLSFHSHEIPNLSGTLTTQPSLESICLYWLQPIPFGHPKVQELHQVLIHSMLATPDLYVHCLLHHPLHNVSALSCESSLHAGKNWAELHTDVCRQPKMLAESDMPNTWPCNRPVIPRSSYNAEQHGGNDNYRSWTSQADTGLRGQTQEYSVTNITNRHFYT